MQPSRNELVNRSELKRLLGLDNNDRVDTKVLVNAIAQLDMARDLVGARLSDTYRFEYKLSMKEVPEEGHD